MIPASLFRLLLTLSSPANISSLPIRSGLMVQAGVYQRAQFEHTMLLTDVFLDVLLPEYGLEVIDKTFYNDYSLFYTTRKAVVKLVVPRCPICAISMRGCLETLFLITRGS